MKFLSICLLLVLVSSALCGCGLKRKLKITEIQPDAVELYLDEPSSKSLDLTGMKLKWVSQDPMPSPSATPVRGELNLGVAGHLKGGQFLVIFEQRLHTGPPDSYNFAASIPGIRVAPGFFPGYGNDPGVSFSVNGTHERALFYIDKVSDAVCFGPRPRPRPSPGSSFYEDGSLDHAKPHGSHSISRAFVGTAPVDTDRESDWSDKIASPGVATGP